MKISLTIFILSFSIACGADYYVAVTGSDATGDGSLGNPYATLSNAVVKSLAITGFVDQKNIYLCAGNYYSTSANINGWVSGGGGGNMLIAAYTNGVILYGGQILTGWSANGDGTYTASLGAFPGNDPAISQTTTWQPRILLADGSRVRWAEYPDAMLSGTNKLHLQNDPTLNFSTITYTNLMTQTTNNEVCVDNSWNDAQLAVTDIDTGTKVMTLSGAVYRGAGNQQADDVRTYTLRNGSEGMLNPNTFWWNKTNNSIIFKPPVGKVPSSMSVVVPTSTKIIYLNGDTGGSVLSNIVVSNITLACTTAKLHDGSKKDPGQWYDGALSFKYTTNCAIWKCTIYACANSGIEGGNSDGGFNYGMTIRDCIIHDCGAGGISMRGLGSGAVISNNLIYDIWGLTKCAMGICPPVGEVSGTNYIVSNTVTNCDGPGIYCAEGQNLFISKNRVGRCVRQLRDMGGIYVYGSTTDSRHIIIQNYVENIDTTNSVNGGVWDQFVIGIYLDLYTSNSIVVSNILFNCASPVMNWKCGTSNTWNNNVLINPLDKITLDFPSVACGAGLGQNVTSNIIYCLGTPAIVASADSVNDWTKDVFYTIAGLTNNIPVGSVISDPLFIKVPTTSPQYLEDSDFNFKPGSPCPGLGIQPLSLAGIGYNGGLTHRPPNVSATTLRVGNMRMSQ